MPLCPASSKRSAPRLQGAKWQRAMAITVTAHIHLDDAGVAWIDDTNTKVVEVVLDKMAYGWSAEEMHLQHPHLSMAQIHAALSYYHDHQKDLDEEIERRYREAGNILARTARPPARHVLEARLQQRPEPTGST
jgi:uncharacterized protein (DUF433 family)